jgi:hypothetical protein
MLPITASDLVQTVMRLRHRRDYILSNDPCFEGHANPERIILSLRPAHARPAVRRYGRLPLCPHSRLLRRRQDRLTLRITLKDIA